MAAQRTWIENRLIPGAGKGAKYLMMTRLNTRVKINLNSGEINLRRRKTTSELGGELVKGNVYFDDQPLCDDGWGAEEAKVACRWACLLFRKNHFPPECWDTAKVSLKSSQYMEPQREGKSSGGHISNAKEMRRAWKTVEARRIQAVREEKLQELHVTWGV